LEQALRRFDEVMITTIHGFCKRVLETSAFETGMPFETEFVQDEKRLREAAALDFWRRRIYPDSFLAQVSLGIGLTPISLLDEYDRWRSHPGIELLPPGEELANAAARLRLALEGVAEKWSFAEGEVLGLVETLTLNANPYLGSDTMRGELQAGLEGDYGALLRATRQLTPEAVMGQVNKRKHREPIEHDLFSRCEEVSTESPRFAHALRVAFIQEVDRSVRKAKEEQGIFSFDDLLTSLDRVLCDDDFADSVVPAIARQFDAALIDEFQDTDPLQYRIFSRLFSTLPLFFIGDPKQAIYSFRGADIHAYLEARSSAARSYTLGRNWRSSTEMVAGVNALFARGNSPFLYPEIPFHPVRAAGGADETPLRGDDAGALAWWSLQPLEGSKGAPKEWSKAEAGRLFLDRLAKEVVTLLAGGGTIGERPVRPRDIAVLVRKRTQAMEVQRVLASVGVPSVMSGFGNVLESGECHELVRVLRAILSPRDEGALRAALATELWGWNARELHRLNEEEGSLPALIDSLEQYREAWQHGFMLMFERFLAEQGVRARLLAHGDGERRLTNLVHVAELLHQAAQSGNLSPEGLLLWLERTRSRGLEDREQAQLRLESDAEAVQIVTIHSSKGLEYGVVFCPFLWDARRPDSAGPALAHASGRVVLAYGSEAKPFHQRVAQAEELAEDLRLCYVALTRARYRCYVGWGAAGRDCSRSSLAYLLHQPQSEEAAPEDRAEQAMAHIKSVMGGWGEELERFVASNEVMSLEVVAELSALPAWQMASQETGTLSPRLWPVSSSARARQLAGWRMVSYSSLAQGREGERPDHADPEAKEGEAVTEEVVPKGIHAFPRGAAPGTCLHEIFERIDFKEVEREARLQLVRSVLLRHNLLENGVWEWSETVCEMVDAVLQAVLPGAGFRLADVAADARFNEWQFYLPVGDLTPATLSEPFRASGAGWIGSEYGPRLLGLSHETLRGYLNGFIDLAFCHEERWYIVDWKSNFLGPTAEAYHEEALCAEMSRHHYVLQYHLYTAALHRYLKTRLPDYDYERHFGGVYYVFLRGTEPGSARAIYHDRPGLELIEGVLSCIGG
jgi:exodeoxyribonuclease V beta subunit